jgi:hypothetical protein
VTLTIAELGSLSGSRGWYGTSAPGHTFDRGVRELGAARMQLIWSRARPLGFWASARGQQWAKVTGNLTWPVFEAMLAEIAAYEDAVGYRDAYRVTRRRAAPTPTRSRPPAPRPTRMSAYHKALVRWRARAAQGHRDPVPSPPRPTPVTVLSSWLRLRRGSDRLGCQAVPPRAQAHDRGTCGVVPASDGRARGEASLLWAAPWRDRHRVLQPHAEEPGGGGHEANRSVLLPPRH